MRETESQLMEVTRKIFELEISDETMSKNTAISVYLKEKNRRVPLETKKIENN